MSADGPMVASLGIMKKQAVVDPRRVAVRLVAGGLLLWLAAGCASNRLSPEAQKVKAERYETVYTVGSHIPKRVVKGDEASSNDGASPVAVLEGERARDVVRTMQRKN